MGFHWLLRPAAARLSVIRTADHYLCQSKTSFSSFQSNSLSRNCDFLIPITARRNFHVTFNNKKRMAPQKLNETQRKEQLTPILSSGWNMVDGGRDAIIKTFLFKDFNEVIN